MQIYVGTSGWHYQDWNPDLTLDWYIKNSGLNSIELNSSFYRFPFPSMIASWARKTKQFNPNLRWSIKVNRFVTHVFKFSDKAFSTWKKFESLFKLLDENIDFYLFQLPPSLKSSFASRLEEFIKKTKLKERFALEWRNSDWFKKEWVDWAKKLGLTLVSVDAPELPREIFNVNGIVYVRMHGRIFWYSHNYSDKELIEIKEKILASKPKMVYVYFNNNHNMRKNALRMLELLKK